MNLRLETRIGLRYTLGHHRSRLGNFITLVSALGLMLGVGTLITVLSVMNGFDEEMRERILVLIPHIRLTQTDIGSRVNWRDDLLRVSSHPGVESASPSTDLDVLLKNRGDIVPALLYVLNPDIELKQAQLARVLGPRLLARLATEPGMVIGSGLAQSLEADVGDTIVSMIYERADRRLQSAGFEIIGIIHSGTELDQGLAVLSFESLSLIPGQSMTPEGLRVQTGSIFQAYATGRELQKSLPPGYRLSTWQQTHGNLYEAIQMSRYLVSLIVILILAIAAFNLIATLMIASADKQGEIAILKTLGAEPASLARIFAFQGLFIGVFGSAAGWITGVLISLNMTKLAARAEDLVGFKLLNSEVYPLDYLPACLNWGQAGFVVLIAVVLSVLAALYPAWQVSKVRAAQVLRYE